LKDTDEVANSTDEGLKDTDEVANNADEGLKDTDEVARSVKGVDRESVKEVGVRDEGVRRKGVANGKDERGTAARTVVVFWKGKAEKEAEVKERHGTNVRAKAEAVRLNEEKAGGRKKANTADAWDAEAVVVKKEVVSVLKATKAAAVQQVGQTAEAVAEELELLGLVAVTNTVVVSSDNVNETQVTLNMLTSV